MYGIRLHNGIPFENLIVIGIETIDNIQNASTRIDVSCTGIAPSVTEIQGNHTPTPAKINGKTNEKLLKPARNKTPMEGFSGYVTSFCIVPFCMVTTSTGIDGGVCDAIIKPTIIIEKIARKYPIIIERNIFSFF
jgi:hypothetical protein